MCPGSKYSPSAAADPIFKPQRKIISGLPVPAPALPLPKRRGGHGRTQQAILPPLSLCPQADKLRCGGSQPVPTRIWGRRGAPPEEGLTLAREGPQEQTAGDLQQHRLFCGRPAGRTLYAAVGGWLVESSFYPGTPEKLLDLGALVPDHLHCSPAAKLDFANNVQLSLTLAALSLGLWWTFDRSRSGLGLGITIAFLATLITQLLVYNGVYQYTSPDFLYIRSWLPCIFFSGGVTVGNIGRQLAMGVPEKPHSD
ncbi:insulin-induced gene 1 protein isoform X2 [Phyllostomus discolor]|uniref:Insulin-induced gene protein n=1 Tax=Phyllostomus discolor TaxID=89673 RepID=A0A7E6CL77_9CHIR|nr:insulin-induced gene 1 protein isoform X2 [Phyllostomus discolor]